MPAYPALMRLLARRAGLRLFRFFSRPLASDRIAMPGIEMRIMDEPAVQAFCDDAGLDLKPSGVSEAFARGDLCVGALERETLAGYCWLAFAPVHHLDGVWVDFAADAVWTYKSLVRPSHRGRGIAAALYRFADAQCRGRGRAASVLCVENHNTPSVRAAQNAGYAHAGRAAYVRGSRGLRAWYSAPVGRLGVRFYLPGERVLEPVPAG